MTKLLGTCAVFAVLSTAAFAESDGKVLTTIPDNAITMTDFYKQNVYDRSDNKIGDIKDVLVDHSSGRIAAFIVGVGGFLGAGEKDVAEPFEAIKATQKNGKWRLVMNANKDELKNAPGFTYDRDKTKWVPEKK
jgi:sporulation protein YlmC with PRC-barrel domain